MKPTAEQVDNNYFHHKQALKSAKPMVSTHRKDMTPSKNNKKEIQNYDQKALVYKMFKSVPKQKGTLDNHMTGTFLRKKSNLQPKRNKYDKYQEHAHQLELRSMKERIQNCGGLLQRKKRGYDPITHPTYFMRKPEDPLKKTVKKQNEPKSTLHRPNSAHPRTNEVPSHLYSGKPCYKDHSSTIIQPAEPTFPDPTLKSIIDYLVDNRVYKQIEIRVLYERLCLRYGQELIDPVWQKAMTEMERQN